MKSIRKAVIPAAGFGTRFLPATKAQPKEMLPIVDTPAIQYIVKEALDSGIEEILIITGRSKRAIEDHFDSSVELEELLQKQGKNKQLAMVKDLADIKIHFIRQKSPRGLGDAVLCAKAFIGDEPFAVLLGDDIVYNPEKPCLQQLMDCYEQHPGIILGAQFVPNEKVSSYGIVSGEPLADNLYRVHGLVEKPSVDKAPSNLAVLGRYILTPDIFDILENTKPGVGNEVQLTDALAVSKTDTYALAYEGVRYDTGDKLGYLKATVEYALRNEELGAAFKEYLKGLKL
ncbi:MAG: UTP--glucose-1-phosphate uridylyltransferase GalU [Veillonella sp.]|uniref:UTP--glucose-1-phosphate uridylyltransferase GalU n=1 Tax=Veillonella sp. TaxID=1926307 RepID=UPI002902884B|nr:UTP--glucose-1-phosphate uridylyltransferase GalU [Veillonella sp.]MDU1342406.1 UTP--glucose-1-phosphate uridylyltransferase GalU [Veillonella sp.]MDU1416621.1 UTP--glucose-1-phosphate uridylyltransferase GalU [Veillonella sp.]MDU3600774.1 UTP--glucose-1-phosphate uridylyltransferase GalU [Veillonella sp.]MDU3602607.1 UTP--glucose-1-phosphate uridylyltransferase GalU [Veillonella sp.]